MNLERHTCSIRIGVRMVRANECESCCHISKALLIAFVDSGMGTMCDSCTHTNLRLKGHVASELCSITSYFFKLQ